MLGGFLALLSAAAFALNNAFARRGVLSGSVLQAMAISVPFGVPFFFVGLLAFGSLEDLKSFSPRDLMWLAAAGVLHFVVGRYANYRGAKAIGANLMGPVQDVNIVLSLALAVWFLGETITPLMALGILLVCLGPVLTFEGRRGARAADAKPRPPRAYTPAYAEGFFFAALSAVAYGSSPILIRHGLQGGGGSGVGRAVAAGLVSYAAATAAVAVFLLSPRSLRDVTAVRRADAWWFTLAGLFVGVAQMLRYMALALAPVSIVSPMMRLASVFRVYFSWLINREHEEFGRGVLLATVVSLVGAVILSLQAEAVVAWLDPSPAVAAFLRLRWP